jgi:hypothetical protein
MKYALSLFAFALLAFVFGLSAQAQGCPPAIGAPVEAVPLVAGFRVHTLVDGSELHVPAGVGFRFNTFSNEVFLNNSFGTAVEVHHFVPNVLLGPRVNVRIGGVGVGVGVGAGFGTGRITVRQGILRNRAIIRARF